MRFVSLLLTVLFFSTLTAQQVIITGLLDPDIPTATPRAVELYVQGTVDLSTYNMERYAGGGMVGTIALTGEYTDEFVYVINSSQADDFTQAFGANGDFGNRILTANFVIGNGNDPFVLLTGGAIVDQVGGDLSNTTDIYENSYLYRVDGTGPDGAWIAANWLNVGNNESLDGVGLNDLADAVPFGTYLPPNAGPTITVAPNGDLAEPATDGGFTVSLSEPAPNDVTVSYTLAGTATAGSDYNAPSGQATIAVGNLSTTVTIEVLDDNESELTETIVLTLTATSDATYTLGGDATINVLDDEPVAAVAISEIQGSGLTSSFTGQTVTVEGIVVGDFQGPSGEGLGGFFVQEEDMDADSDPLTSEGIWIFQGGTGTEVDEGDLVVVTGVVEEDRGLTQLNATEAGGMVTVSSTNNTLPSATELDLPVADEDNYEPYEGMRVTLTDEAIVTSNFGLGRFGEVEISVDDRLIQFTECNAPDPTALAAYNAAQDARRIIVDDGRSGDNNFPVVLPNGEALTPSNTLRAGTTFRGLTGVMDERFTGYRIQLTDPGTVQENDRPSTAPELGGNLTVVGMNLLNYFTTLGARGADNTEEFDRQEAKIVAAICELDADVLGLVEIENNGTGPGSATQALIDAINAGCGKRYTAVAGSGIDFGTDQIKVQLIYDATVVEESGTAVSLNTPADVFSSNRPPLAQTFRIIEPGSDGLGGEVTVVVNHWKSKGGSCGAGDDDNGGAGSCNGTRLNAANAIKDWLADNPTGAEVAEQLIIGDLNAYSEEPPLTTLTNDGFKNVVREFSPEGSFPCGSTPSYVFRGEWGSLDHALASAALRPFVTGATPWNVNAAEPTALDYDTEFNDASLYAPDFYRFSDHDPVVVGLQLEASLPAQLISFTGEEREGRVVLNWVTATEDDVSGYDVLRRTAEGTFTLLGTVAARGGVGASAEYNFTDELPLQGENVYRLRVVDADGSSSLSRLVTIVVDRPNSIEFTASGADSFQLSNAPRGSSYTLTDVNGRQLRHGRTREATERITAARLPAGVYFLNVTTGDQRRFVFKFVLP